MNRFDRFTAEELTFLAVAIAIIGQDDFPEARPLLTEINQEIENREPRS